VPIYEIGQEGGQHYFTMAFIEGVSLRALVRKEGAQAPERAADLVGAMADAVEHAHRHGIIHRDLKPDNVLIDSTGRPRVTDFGLAKQRDGEGGLTASGAILGTPAYMAPEQVETAREVGPPADVYALGGILYFLLTGQPPFDGDSVHQLLMQLLMHRPTPPRRLNPEVPPDLEAICLKCLEKEPSNRYPTAAAVADALRATRQNTVEPTRSRTVPAMPRPAPAAERRFRWARAGLAVAVLAALVGAGWALTRPWSASPTPSQPGSTRTEGSRTDQAKMDRPGVDHFPPPTRHDFGLTLEVAGGKPGPGGELQVPEGPEAVFRVTADRDAYVFVWNIDADGVVTWLFPNEHETDNKIKKGQTRVIPGGDYSIKARLSRGLEQLRVVASTEPWEPIQGEKAGPFQVFQSLTEREKLHQGLREFVVGPQRGVAEEAVKYRVVTRP
jgi:hypothetical protein